MRRVALLVVPLLLAACGGSGGGSSSTSTTGTATTADATAAVNQAVARGAKKPVHAVVSGVVTASGQQVHLNGKADVAPKARQGTIHVSLGLGTQQIPLDEVLDGKTVYVSSSFFTSFLPSGKRWVKVTLASAAKTFGPAAFALTSQPGAVPPLKDARRVGSATIDGTQTTEYTAHVDQAKLSPAAKAALTGTHVDFGTVDVWVGTDGYVHRVRIATTSSSGGTKAKIVVTSTLSNYGENVDVTIPATSETVDANKIGIPGFSS